MPVEIERSGGWRDVDPIPGDGLIVHMADHGSFLIAVRWDGTASVPWVIRAEPFADWYRMAIH